MKLMWQAIKLSCEDDELWSEKDLGLNPSSFNCWYNVEARYFLPKTQF